MAIAGVSAWAVCLGLRRVGVEVEPVSMYSAVVVAAAGGLAPDLDHPWSLASFSIPVTLFGYGCAFLAAAAWQRHQHGPHLINLSTLGPAFFSAAWMAVWTGLLLLTLSLLASVFFGHRGPMHSVAFGVLATLVVTVGLAVFHAPLWWAMAFAWGWISHLLADATTTMGLPSLLWPLDSFESAVAPPVVALTVVPEALQSAKAPVSDRRSEVPLCPVCGVPMVLRTAKRGESQGRRFYGCANFPRCRQTRHV